MLNPIPVVCEGTLKTATSIFSQTNQPPFKLFVMLTFQRDRVDGGSLILHYTAKTAKDYATMSAKLFSHSEYDTEWDEKVQEWRSKGYFKHVFKEEFRGYTDYIFRISFHELNICKEFLEDVNNYFSEHPWGMVHQVKLMDIETLI